MLWFRDKKFKVSKLKINIFHLLPDLFVNYFCFAYIFCKYIDFFPYN